MTIDYAAYQLADPAEDAAMTAAYTALTSPVRDKLDTFVDFIVGRINFEVTVTLRVGGVLVSEIHDWLFCDQLYSAAALRCVWDREALILYRLVVQRVLIGGLTIT